VVVRRGEIRRIGWTIKVLESQVDQFFLVFKWPVSRVISMQIQDTLGEIPGWFFLQNFIQLLLLNLLILRADSLALRKIISEENYIVISKIYARNFPSDFLTRDFLGRRETPCRHSIECCFVSRS